MERAGPGRAGPRAAVAAAVLLAATVAAVGLWGFSYDDAFITYRYAQNLAAGRGLVFNPGEAVLGTTAPGWAVVLGAASAVSVVPVAGWGTLLSVLALAVAAGLVPLAVLRAAPAPWRAGFPALLAALALTLPWNLQMLGAETFAVLALGLAAASLMLAPRPAGALPPSPRGETGPEDGRADGDGGAPARGRREIGAGLLVAAAMFLRLDAAAAALAVGVAAWATGRRMPWRYGLAGLLPVLPWLAWLRATYGAFLPVTLAAKSNLAGTPSVRGDEVAGGPGWWWTYSGDQWRWLLRDLPAWGGVVLLALAAVGLAALAVGLRRGGGAGATVGARPWAPFLAAVAGWLLLHEATYRAVGVPFAPWYHLHLVLAVLALAAGGALALAAAAARRAGRLPRSLHLRPALLAAVFVAPVVALGVRYLVATWDRPPDGRQPLYAAVGRFLADHSAPGDVVASMEIGVLAYVADRPVLDLVGLVDPEVEAARAAGTLPDLVAERRPRYVLTAPHLRTTVLGDVLDDPQVAALYRPLGRFSVPSYRGGTAELLVLREP